MLRRCIRDISSVRPVTRIPRPIATQVPFLSLRSGFSNAPKLNSPQKTSPAEETPHSKNYISKFVLGSIVLGAAATAAYQAGYIDLWVKDRNSPITATEHNVVTILENLKTSTEQMTEKPGILKPNVETFENENELLPPKDLDREVVSEIAAAEEPDPVKENESQSIFHESHAVSDENEGSTTIESKDFIGEAKIMARNEEQSKGTVGSVVSSEDSVRTEAASYYDTNIELPKDSSDTEIAVQKSLSDLYSLQDEESPKVSEKIEAAAAAAALFSRNKEEVSIGASEHQVLSDDGKIILDLIEAIHAAEIKQAESDFYIFSEEKRKLKEKYEKEVRDARARELMYAEEAAILEKELNKEKVKSATVVKTLEEKAEQKLQEELQRKDVEDLNKLEKVQELAKAELGAAIAKEKASQIEKIAEANLNINALCMAFYARSEEARQSHSVHKLSLGTLALEEALSKGLPVRTEIDSLRKSLEGIDKDSLLELALSSLPDAILDSGTQTQMQLNERFNSLKEALRHFSLIPAGGGGILAHAVAYIASSIKMKQDQFGDGIESLISRVENFLANGKLAEAADALEGALHGSEAEEVVIEWVRHARTRAIAEQTLSLLQSYATSITYS